MEQRFEDLSSIREFRIASEYRRCAWYVVIGFLLVAAVVYWLRVQNLAPPQRRPQDLVVPFCFFSAFALGLLTIVYQWRLRIDAEGIARRRLGCWDCWKWEEFETGQVQRVASRFAAPSHPFWRRQLSLEFLAEPDRKFVLEICKHYFRPALEVLPTRLELRYRFRAQCHFDEEGVSIREGKANIVAPWTEVTEIRLVSFDHWSPGIRKLEISLPNRLIVLEHARVTGFVSSHVQSKVHELPPIVEQFLRTYVRPGQLRRFALCGPPESIQEYEYRLMHLKKRRRAIVWAEVIVPSLLFVLMLVAFAPKLAGLLRGPMPFPNLGWLVVTVVMYAMIIISQPLVFWAVLRHVRKVVDASLAELENWRSNQKQP